MTLPTPIAIESDHSFLSNNVQNAQASASFAIVQRARELKAQGRDIINLAGGDPDFDTPLSAQEAAITAIKSGQTKYTPLDGTVALKTAVQAKFKRDNKLHYDLDQLIVTNGVKGAIFNAFIASLNTGDEVIIPAPHWVSYPEMVTIAGGKPIIVPTQASHNFKLTPDELAAAITPKTKWFMLNSPNNPSGAVYSAEELKALSQVLMAHPNVHVMSDDIYELITFERNEFCSIASVCPELYGRTLTVNGVSKSFAMTGWRIGYAGGPAFLIKAMKKVQSQSTSCPSSISQAAALGALESPKPYVEEWRAAYHDRRLGVFDGLNKVKGLEPNLPQGAFYIFTDCSGLMSAAKSDGTPIQSDFDLTDYLLEEAGVAVTPGSAFNMSPYFRLSLADESHRLGEAIERIAKAVGKLKAV